MTRSMIGQIVEIRTLVPIAGSFVHDAIVLAESGEGLQAILGVVIINSTGIHYHNHVRHFNAGGDFSSLSWGYLTDREIRRLTALR